MQNYLLFFITNIIFYILFLIVLNNSIKNKYYYPFRTLDVLNLFVNIAVFCPISLFYFDLNIFIMTIITNLNFFYILFHLQNMVNTSSRTKILIDVYNKANIKKYTEKNIVKNRIKRLLSNNQIIINNNIIKLNKNKKSLYLVNLIFKLIKKF